ncbi:MAG: hypothetical protein JSW21_02860, partial [Gammaproteobacteria bacterium]
MQTRVRYGAPCFKAAARDKRHGMSVRLWRFAAGAVISYGLALGLILICTSPAGATEPALSQRTPLLDVAMRAEVDSYSRLDRIQERSAQLPDVYDPGIYLREKPAPLVRGELNQYLLWLESQRADHFFAVESLPERMAVVPSSEPYTEALIAGYRDSTPERLSFLQEFYDSERDLITLHLPFMDFVETKAESSDAFGFAFKTEEDMNTYSDAITKANQAFSRRQAAVGRYQ